MWRQKILNNVEKEIHEIMFITMTPYLYLFLSFKYGFDFQIMWWRNTDIPQFTIMYIEQDTVWGILQFSLIVKCKLYLLSIVSYVNWHRE